MPWLLTSPGHQQPWYWLCRICRFLSYYGRMLSTCIISMWSNDIKCKYMFMLLLNNLARKGLRTECLKIHLYPCGLHSWFIAATWYTALQREIKNNMYVPHICPRHLIFDVCELRGISALIFFKFIRAMWQCTIYAFLNIIQETARLLISSHYGNNVSSIELTSFIY